MTADEIRALNFDANDDAVIAELAAIVSLAEQGNDSAFQRANAVCAGRQLARNSPLDAGLSKADRDKLWNLIGAKVTA
jgi:hypothetical protein